MIPLKSFPATDYLKTSDLDSTVISEFNPSWSHLQVVYELLLRFTLSDCVDMKSTKRYFTHHFIVSLISKFDSKDQREREYLKTILHRIYLKYMPLRTFIRHNINYTLLMFLFETQSFSGIGELLEIYGSVISGYSLPLKSEHLQFLYRILLPLHSGEDDFAVYHPQLCNCIYQYIEKDEGEAVRVVRLLIRRWPYTKATKQLLFINEIEEILALIRPNVRAHCRLF
jgi:serine/threonine-protein phosphatase 2A regulatory subunit B'